MNNDRPTPYATIVARVVPTGIVVEKGVAYATATLALTPRPCAENEPKGVHLSAWPKEIESRIGAMCIYADRIPQGAGSIPSPRPYDELRSTGLERHPAPSHRHDEKILELWGRLMQVDDWSLLGQVLQESQAGDSLDNLSRTTGESAGADDATAVKAPDVLPFSRGDAALIYALERAREVLHAVQGKSAACKLGSCHVNTRGLTLDPTRFTFNEKPWLGLREPVMRFAQNANPSTKTDASPWPANFSQSDLLALERREQETALRAKLKPKADVTDRLHDARSNFLKAKTVQGGVEALARHAALRATSLSPSGCVAACGAGATASAADDIKGQSKAAHSLGTMQDLDEFGDPVIDPFSRDEDARVRAVRTTRERFNYIQSMPSLARLFNFVVDVRTPLAHLQEIADESPDAWSRGWQESGVTDHRIDERGEPRSGATRSPAHYIFVSAAFGAPSLDLPVWSLAKIRVPASGAHEGHFWLCSTEEMLLRLAEQNDLRSSCAVFQFDGVMDLGVAALDSTGARNPRYDISSLDAISTIESDIQFDRRIENVQSTNGKSLAGGAALGVHTRRTAGLVLVDRWRQDQVVSQIATARSHTDALKSPDGKAIVLDAEQLTLGYRLDVGMKVDRNRRHWRSLMHRRIAFWDPEAAGDEVNWIEDVVDGHYRIDRARVTAARDNHASGGVHEMIESRMRADGGVIALASRLKRNRPGGTDASSSTAFVEEVVATWQGDPLGIECIELDRHSDDCGTAVNESSRDGFSMESSVIALKMDFSLPTNREAYLPPRLRYGWPYHFGMRPVYVGGVVLPLELAIPRYETNFGTGLALPGCDAKAAGRRLLRHERIEAPTLTLSASELRRMRKDVKDSNRDGSEGAADFMLLKRRVGKAAKDKKLSTFRILTPPVVSLQDAALHGALDRLETEAFKRKIRTANDAKEVSFTRPKDGLAGIDFDGARGGFPHLPLEGRDKKDGGPAVFRFAAKRGARDIPFYPDPAAHNWVIVARRVSSEEYLGGSIVRTVFAPGDSYPNVAPLAIEIETLDAPRKAPARTIKELCRDERIGTFRPDGTLGDGAGLKVQRVIFALAPGEDFEFEIWCAPSHDSLRDIFDVPENMALLIARDGADNDLTNGTIDQVCRSSLLRNLPDSKQFPTKATSAGSNAYCGIGGEILPGHEIIDTISKTIERALCLRPILELAATTRIRVTHAIDKPIVAPSFSPSDLMPDGVRVVRLDPATLNEAIGRTRETEKTSVIARKAAAVAGGTAPWGELSDDGATSALFDADIDVDLLSTSDIEFRALVVSPTSPTIDDPRLGRSAEDMARGRWPMKTPEGMIRFDEPTSAFDPEITRRLFGFSVLANGRVVLPLQDASLLTLRDLPDVCIANRTTGAKRYNLLLEQRRAGDADRTQRANAASAQDGAPSALPDWHVVPDPADRVCRSELVQPFNDPIARQLHLTVRATSRYAGLFRKPEGDEDQALVSPPACVWLPATRRPDRVSPRSLTPAFVWSRQPAAELPAGFAHGVSPKASLVRECVVRVRMRRPWFTSGEGERLGVVLWPPRLLSADTTSRFEENLAADVLPAIGPSGRGIAATLAFDDADLGSGGPFVTRWGADPIREGAEPKGWLMPPSAFVDYEPNRPSGPEFEEAVLMPIPRADNKSGPQIAAANDKPDEKKPQPATTLGEDQREYLTVSLLTYEPRFDPEYEHWYVDIAIDPKDVPEPFLRLGLVRFQKNARRVLQVSEPVVEWIQIMPKRTVCVAERQAVGANGAPTRRVIGVSVQSPADYGVDATGDQCAPDTASRAPFMRAYVVRSVTKPDGGVHQTVVTPWGAASDPCVRIPPTRAREGTLWNGDIEFPDEPAGPGETCRHAVFVEEIQTFLPATFADEPVARGRTSGAIESGPRFAAWIDLDEHKEKPPKKTPTRDDQSKRRKS
jgi:hypothetical protein